MLCANWNSILLLCCSALLLLLRYIYITYFIVDFTLSTKTNIIVLNFRSICGMFIFDDGKCTYVSSSRVAFNAFEDKFILLDRVGFFVVVVVALL